ncbi:hypothetical protein BCR42DRAFT_311411, partial [Absidia repens]
ISHLQEEVIEIAKIRSGVTWFEQSEKSPKYLAAKIKSRQSRQIMTAIHDPSAPESDPHADDPSTMQARTRLFYQTLFTKDDINQTAIDSLLQHIPPSLRLTEEHSASLLSPFSLDDLLHQ